MESHSDQPVKAASLKGTVFITDIFENYPDALIYYSHFDKMPKRAAYKVIHKSNEYILKTIHATTEDENYELELKQREFIILKKLGSMHPNIAKGIEIRNKKISKGETRCEILMEDAGDTLDKLIKSAKPHVILKWIINTLSAMKFIQEMGMSVFDFKPSNIAYKNGVTKIINLECALQFARKEDTAKPLGKFKSLEMIGTTPIYAPQDLLKSLKKRSFSNLIGSKFDTFCWGMSFCQILTKENFSWLKNLFDSRMKDKSEDYYKSLATIDKKRLILQNGEKSYDFSNIILGCLKYDQEERISFDEIFQKIKDFKDINAELVSAEKYCSLYNNSFAEKKAELLKGDLIKTDIFNEYKDAIIYTSPLYEGSNRKVYKVINKSDQYILKIIDTEAGENDNELDQIKHEFNISEDLGNQHPNIAKGIKMKTQKISEEVTRCEILMEYAGDSLAKLITSAKPHEIVMWIIQSLSAMRYAEEMRISHFDIKPANIVYQNGVIKIIDFGCAVGFSRKADTAKPLDSIKSKEVIGATPCYAPPELFQSKNDGSFSNLIGSKFDVYCWGMTFYQILAKKDICFMNEFLEFRMTASKEEYCEKLQILRKELSPIKIGTTLYDFSEIIIGCLNYEKEKRPNFEEIRQKIKSIEDIGYTTLINAAEAYNLMGKSYNLNASNYNLAMEYCKRALEIRLAMLGDRHPSLIETYHNLANAYSKKGEDKEVLDLHLKGLQLCLENYGVDSEKSVLSYLEVGRCYSYKHEHLKALEYYKKAIEICEKLLGEDHPDTIQAYYSLGLEYLYLKNYEEAEKYHRKAFNMAQRKYGDDHYEISRFYNSLGNLYKTLAWNMRNKDDNTKAKIYFSKAEKYLNKALKIRQRHYGEDHPITASSYNNLGTLFKEIMKLGEAKEFYDKALKIRLEAFTEKHGSVAESYVNLGDYYSSSKRFPKALEYYSSALKIRLALYEENHGSIGDSYVKLGKVSMKLKETEMAIKYYMDAVKIFESQHEKNNEKLIELYTNLADYYFDCNDCENSIKYYLKSIEFLEKVENITLDDITNKCCAIGDKFLDYDCKEQDCKKDAWIFFLKAAELEEYSKRETEQSAYVFHKAGFCLKLMKEIKESERYLLLAYKIRCSKLGSEHKDTASTSESLGDIYKHKNCASTALKYYNQAKLTLERIYGENDEAVKRIERKIKKFEKAAAYYNRGNSRGRGNRRRGRGRGRGHGRGSS